MYISSNVDVGTGGSWVELPVQRRLCPIFISGVGLPCKTREIPISGKRAKS